jgi:predicted  nucleic acid-binding Zn-ribbon protein
MNSSNTSNNIKNQDLSLIDKVKNIPVKYLLLVMIVIGLFLGYYINNYVNEPRINNLVLENENAKNEIINLQSSLSDIQNNFEDLESDFSTLSDLYEETLNTHIPFEDYNSLQEEHSLLLENYEIQNETIEKLKIDKRSLSDLNVELIKDYNKLIIKYNEIRVLSWVFFVIDGMEINVTSTKNSYTELEDITGVVSITSGGKSFKGQVEFRVWSVFFEQGTSGFNHNINGDTEFSIHNGFLFGPGQYTLGLSKIIDDEGEVIANIDELKDYKIKIEMG